MPLPMIDTPTYELKLPSSNKKIKYRPFLVKEEKVLMPTTGRPTRLYFSNNVDIQAYTSWGEENNGVKVKFSNGYKRIS